MILMTSELGNFPDVAASQIDQILDDNCLGEMALIKCYGDFINASNLWSPSQDCDQIPKRQGSDTWVLQYCDPSTHLLLEARGNLTLDQVRHVFLAYLRDDLDWRAEFEWGDSRS